MAQDFHALVYFNDKPNVASLLAQPLQIMTQRALDRKNRHGIPIDFRDVPMNQSYVNQVKIQPGIAYKAQSKWFNCVHVSGNPLDIDALAQLTFVSGIQYFDPTKAVQMQQVDKLHRTVTTPLSYGTARNQIEMLGLDHLHNLGHTGSGMLIAVTDSGFPNVDQNPGFAQLRNNNGLAGGWDFVDKNNQIYDDHFHGSRVLSVMAGNDPGNFEGSAPDAQYLLYRTEEAAQETPAEMSYWVQAAERADSLGVDVINVSLGYLNFDNNAESLNYQDMNGQTAFISLGANTASEKGMMVVVSAGNSGNSSSHPYVAAPADALGAIAIGSVNSNSSRSSFSSIGPTADNRLRPEVMAQGGGTASIDESGNLVSSSGTSFSAPLISGSIACLMQAYPSLIPDQIRQAVRESADQFLTPDQQLGYGIPDFGNAFITLSENSTSISDHIYVLENRLFYDFAQGENAYDLLLYNLQGQQILQKKLDNKGQIDLPALSAGIYLCRIPQLQKTWKILFR